MSSATLPAKRPVRPWVLFSRVLLYTICIALSIFFLFPIGWSILTSLKPPVEASASPSTGLPSHLVFDNYVKLNN